MENLIKELGAEATALLKDVLVALIIFVIGFRLIAWFEKRLKQKNKLSRLDPTTKTFVVSFVTIALKIMVLLIILSIVGIPIASIVTVISSCAVAIGLALQGGLSNIAGGVMILIFRPFKVGDYIEACGLEGTVKSITMFYTTITTIDNKVVQIPNGTLSNSNIVNYSGNETRRVDLQVSVAYNTDINKVKKLIRKLVEEHPLILQEEEKTIRLKYHGDSALIFVVRAWTKTDTYWDVYYDLMEEIKETFDKNKIQIPFPQMDVHVTK